MFNTVFTSNFDDLLNEACYLYSSNLRPVVCAHDSSIKSVRITSKRPKIIKLHGDYLFDNIKNTSKELRNLGQNMEEKFRQYAPEYGLIVVGYSGRDESIMDCLESLLSESNSYPHGIYWCVRDENDISDKVKNLQRYSGFNLIKIEGFDEFFADLHDELSIPLQNELSNPYEALKERLNNFANMAGVPLENTHHVIANHIQDLSKKLGSKQFDDKVGTGEVALPIVESNIHSRGGKNLVPFMLIADAEYRNGKVSNAQHFIKLYLETTFSVQSIRLAIETLSIVWEESFADQILNKIGDNIKVILKVDEGFSCNTLVELLKAKRFEYAKKIADLFLPYIINNRANEDNTTYDYFIINYSQIIRFLGVDIPADIIQIVQKILEDKKSSILTRIGAFIVLGRYDDAYNLLQSLDKNDALLFVGWPIAELMPDNLLIDFISKLALHSDEVNKVHNIALKYINAHKYDVADAVLDRGLSIGSPLFSLDIYWINKAQIFIHKNEVLPADVEQHVEKILENPLLDEYIKMGCYIVLGRQEEARLILNKISDQKVRAWPIVQLIERDIITP